jgi:hypothetical protein
MLWISMAVKYGYGRNLGLNSCSGSLKCGEML